MITGDAKTLQEGSKDVYDDLRGKTEDILEGFEKMFTELGVKSVVEKVPTDERADVLDNFYYGKEGSDDLSEVFQQIDPRNADNQTLLFRDVLGDVGDDGTVIGDLASVIGEDAAKKFKDEIMSAWKEDEDIKDIIKKIEGIMGDLMDDDSFDPYEDSWDPEIEGDEKEVRGAFEVSNLLTELIRETKNLLHKEFGNENAKKLRRSGSPLIKYFKPAYEKVGELTGKVRTLNWAVPSVFDALSLMQNMELSLNEKTVVSLPTNNFLGQILVAYNQLFSHIGDLAGARGAQPTRGKNSVLRGFFRSAPDFHTHMLAGTLLKDMIDIWEKAKDKAGVDEVSPYYSEKYKTQRKKVTEALNKFINKIENGEKIKSDSKEIFSATQKRNLMIVSNYPASIGGLRMKGEDLLCRRFTNLIGKWFAGSKPKSYTNWQRGIRLLEGPQRKQGLTDLDGKELEQKITEAAGVMRERMPARKGQEGRKQAYISAAMRHIITDVFSEYANVLTQLQLSELYTRIARSYNQLSLALTKLAYAQDAYNTDSKAALLLIKAVRQLRYHSEHTLPPTYGELKNQLHYLEEKASDIRDTLQAIEAYEGRLGEEGMKNIYEKGVKSSIEEMREKVIPELEEKDREEILEKLEKEKLGLNEKLHDRLETLLREGTLLVKNGRITVTSLMTIAKLMATERRLKNIHLVKDAPDVDMDVKESETWFLSSGISLWWVKGRMKGEGIDVSVEGVEEKLDEIKGELQKEGLRETIKDLFEGEVDATGEEEIKNTELMLGYLKGMRDAKNKSRSIGKKQRGSCGKN